MMNTVVIIQVSIYVNMKYNKASRGRENLLYCNLFRHRSSGTGPRSNVKNRTTQ